MRSVSEAKAGPKRSLLAQGRSRDTRQAIIKAALELWSERGYDTGIDDTTAEEIAARAGVAKATFYFHFARKDDILLALRRMLRAQISAAPDTPHTWNDPDHFGFRRGFAVIFLHAQQSGDMPQTVIPDSLGAMFEAQLMSSMHDWAHEEEASLLATLRQRFAVLLAGARSVSADALGAGSRVRRARDGRRPGPGRRESHTESEFDS